MPPKWMWHLSSEIEAHFEQVTENRKHGNTRSDRNGHDEPTGPMMRNEYAKGRGQVTRV